MNFINFCKIIDKNGNTLIEMRLFGCRLLLPYRGLISYVYDNVKKVKYFFKRIEEEKYEKEREKFLQAKKNYLSRRSSRAVMRRLFITTGNLQLINILAIIEQLKETDECPAENHILVWSSLSNRGFETLNRRLARFYGVSQYYEACGEGWSFRKVGRLLIKHRLYDIDEIYSLQQQEHLELYRDLFQGVEHIITDECLHSLIPSPQMIATHSHKMITTCYLNKLDYVEFSGRTWQVQHIRADKFQEIAAQCTKLFPWPYRTDSDRKTIVYCASYYARWWPFTAERLEEMQKSIVQKLVDKGYFVLYKPHPRDKKLPRESNNLKILHTRLPLECYRLDGVLAVVSLFSSASSQIYHYNGVPGFVDYNFLEEVLLDHLSLLIKDYTPPVDLLLDLEVAKMSYAQLQMVINNLYKSHMECKPKLSENKQFSKAYISALTNKVK